MPALQASLRMDAIFNGEMGDYATKQMMKGYVGWGLESEHESKVFKMTNQSSILHSNLSMVATNVLMEANAILNGPYKLKAQLAFRVQRLPPFSSKQPTNNTIMIPTALEFSDIGGGTAENR